MSAPQPIPRTQRLTEQALHALARFTHIEAVSGIILLIAALSALLWANSPAAASYQHLWHTPVALELGALRMSADLHFLVNEGLMTLFFLVVGAEIRQELHDGALSKPRQALLPLGAALGGVVMPAVLYLAIHHGDAAAHGWAVPTATDIAFAVGVLALLGKSIPSGVRALLLALAVIDDLVAILIIALFYNTGMDAQGLAIAGAAIACVLILQRMGIGNAWIYVAPGALMWYGLFRAGVHPTLAGVVLGLMIPVTLRPAANRPLAALELGLAELRQRLTGESSTDTSALQRMRLAQRDLVAPVKRIPAALHPWVAFGVMPLFALANAGVALGAVDLSEPLSLTIVLGVVLALVLGKPLGVLSASYVLVRLGLCRLPSDVSWRGLTLVGLLAGIGFTMAIFVAGLAFTDLPHLEAAKLGVLMASALAAVLGIGWGWCALRRT